MAQNTALCFYLLGPMRIEREGTRIHLPRRKVESLLAYLLLHPEQHARDHLATLFWGDSTDTQARHSLRTALATVRQEVSPDLLHTDRDHVQLNADFPLWVDLHQLLALEKEIDVASGESLQETLALWQGELLAGLYDEWIAPAREHYQTRLLKLFLQVTQSLRARSEYAQAIAVAQRVLAIDPANEHAHQHLMFCYVASGNRPAALRQYEICVRALEDDLDVSPAPETTALYEWIKQHEGEEAHSAARITNLPIPVSSFVGRTRETAEIKRLLTLSRHQNGRGNEQSNGQSNGDRSVQEWGRTNTVRSLTLTGAGGSGKTRLAIQTATDLIDSFADGVWWVELAALNDEELVARAIAKTLGVRETLDEPLAQSMAKHIGDKQMLLVIDNCEHLIAPVAAVVATLLERCPNLLILATSREPLNIAGETLWQVPALPVPDPAKMTLLDLLLQFESIRLFVERAVAVQPTFALTVENAQTVIEICRQLDGIPLAIELAAARVKVLSVEEIAAYLKRAIGARFNLLTQGSRTAMPRHQTLRATIDWSYNLLDEAERLLFRQIAIFHGGFTLEMLEQIAGAAVGVPPARAMPPLPSTLDLLAQLVDKSLVIVERQAGQNRYRLLETLREYALERFPTREEEAQLQRRHAEVFFDFALQAEPELLGARQRTWLDQLEVEHANLRAALDYLIATNDGERALLMAYALHRFWENRGYVAEGRNWLAAALAIRDTASHATQGHALNAAGRLAFRQGDLRVARQYHEEALLFFEQTEEELDIARTMQYLSVLMMDQGEYKTAQQYLDQTLEIFQRANHQLGIANAFSRLGTLAWDQDRFDDSAGFHRQSLAIYRALDMPMSVAFECLAVGDSERMLGNFAEAHAHYEECLELARTLGNRGLVAATLKSMGLLAVREGSYEQARDYGIESLQIFRELGDKSQTAFAVSHLGEVAQRLGEYPQALVYFQEYLQIMYDIGYKWPTCYALEDIAVLLHEANQHPEVAVRLMAAADVLHQEIDIGVSPHLQGKFEDICADLRQQVSDSRYDALWEEGQSTPLERIVTEATKLTLN